jgi:hypothetical protein
VGGWGRRGAGGGGAGVVSPRAAAYDIRYSTEMITQADWIDAIQLVDSLAPTPAGSPESFTLTGIPIGKLYSGIQIIDDALQSSELSNIHDVEVPYYKISLPLIIQ